MLVVYERARPHAYMYSAEPRVVPPTANIADKIGRHSRVYTTSEVTAIDEEIARRRLAEALKPGGAELWSRDNASAPLPPSPPLPVVAVTNSHAGPFT